MKYFRVYDATEAFPELFYKLYKMVIGGQEDAIETYRRSYPNAAVIIAEEITENQYVALNHHLTMTEDLSKLNSVISSNLFGSKIAAAMLSHTDYPIRVGYPKIHNVYRRNANGDLIFVYHGG